MLDVLKPGGYFSMFSYSDCFIYNFSFLPLHKQMNTTQTDTSLLTYASDNDIMVKRCFINAIELVSGKRKLKKLYECYLREKKEGNTAEENLFWTNMLNLLDISLEYNHRIVEEIPNEGPLILVANHPYGVLDGMIMCHLAGLLRNEFKILTNSLLCRFEETDPYFLPIDFSGTRSALRTNIQTKNDALSAIKDGGSLIVFPAGAVSTAKKPFGKATDSDWKLFTARLVKESQATVVPIFFEGQNSRIFQWASHVSQTIRLSLLMHELRNKMGKTIAFKIGSPIYYQKIENINKRQEVMHLLREKTYALEYAGNQ